MAKLGGTADIIRPFGGGFLLFISTWFKIESMFKTKEEVKMK